MILQVVHKNSEYINKKLESKVSDLEESYKTIKFRLPHRDGKSGSTLDDLLSCDYVLVVIDELKEAFGAGVEVGYAFANKKQIYLVSMGQNIIPNSLSYLGLSNIYELDARFIELLIKHNNDK